MINVTLGAADTQKEKPFPKLMIRRDHQDYTLIFAISKDHEGNIQGFCIATDYRLDTIGKYVDCFSSSKFTDYNDPITIQNA